MDKFQAKGLIILVVIILGTEVFITIAWGVLLKESGKVFQVFLLVSLFVAITVAFRIWPTPQLYSQKRIYKSISPTWTETHMPLALCMTEQQFL